MNDATPPLPAAAGKGRRYVRFGEALWWIACRNLAGWSMGPRSLPEALNFDVQSIAEEGEARYYFAIDLLLDVAARGKVRIYGTHSQGDYLSSSVPEQLDADFIKRSAYVEEDTGPVLFLPDEEDDDRRSRENLVVDFDDLTDQFWGNDRAPTQFPASVGDPVVTDSPAIFQSKVRRGRPPKYAWAEFSAEVAARCSESPIRSQADLEREMTDWCVERWGVEPAPSEIRAHIAPIFKRLVKNQEDKSPGLASPKTG